MKSRILLFGDPDFDDCEETLNGSSKPPGGNDEENGLDPDDENSEDELDSEDEENEQS